MTHSVTATARSRGLFFPAAAAILCSSLLLVGLTGCGSKDTKSAAPLTPPPSPSGASYGGIKTPESVGKTSGKPDGAPPAEPGKQAPDTKTPEGKKPSEAPKQEEAQAPTRSPDVIYVPTPQEVVDKMLEMAGVTKDDVVYDLGCGDGRIVVTAAKKYGCKAVGFDIDPERIQESLENVKKNGVEKLVQIKQADIFQQDLSPASVVTLYLLPELNVKLIPQLEKLKPGSRIVSHAFPMQGVKPKQVVNFTPKENPIEYTIYYWTTPLEKEK